MRGRYLLATVAMGVFLALPAAAAAVTLVEPGDAGSLPATAQGGFVDLINYEIDEPGDEDVYRICLTGNKTFSASTAGSFDTQLFLFDAAGRGVYANDDFNTLHSHLPAGDPLTPSAGGVYYLAISSYNNDPVSEGGEIFGSGFPVQAPDGPGGGSPVTDWTNQGFSTGYYEIRLTGTRPCLPTTKEECKNGGWRDFGVFKNQGDCVSFVATKGKNPPGKK